MAFIRNCFVIAITMLSVLDTNAQTIGYPLQSSTVLKSTAVDIAQLLQKAIAGSRFTSGVYTVLPQSGFIFVYDSTITGKQACRVESDGVNFIKFSASEDNGLSFGIYQYLQQLGFHFYLPGSIWETIPVLETPYKKTDSIYMFNFKYNGWYISGGYNHWVMDKDYNAGWGSYVGINGYNWSLYQRRNGMGGEYTFSGHRSDIISGTNLSTWQNNPCYIANFNNSRVVNSQSVPDVNSHAAMDLWASTIEQKYTAYRTAIFGNPNLFLNQMRNFNYSNFNLGIEVPDGAHWGNSKDTYGCMNGGYASISDQNITLANHTAQKIGTKYPNLRYQLYAYSTHSDIPSVTVPIHEKLDIQLIPTAYQNLTSTNGLRNRWHNRTKNISEYNYLNLSGWSGETPAFNLKDFKATLQIAVDKKTQGLVWEASPAKFASLPYLLAANLKLKANKEVDSTLKAFSNNMFAAAGDIIYNLLHTWADHEKLAGGISDSYKLPLYFQMLNEASQKINAEPEIVKARLRELKAYLHYMAIFYDWAADQRPANAKTAKTAALCLYLARTNKLQLVNSYYLISNFVSAYAANSSFYQQFNISNGTAYQEGNLPLITDTEIENDFIRDVARFSSGISQYKFESTAVIAGRIDAAGLQPLKKINIKLSYTNGMDYYNHSEFMIKAPAAGSFTISYNPIFDMAEKGYINFTVESTDKALEVVEDFSLDRNAKAGVRTVKLPAAGNYKMTVSSLYKSMVVLDITTNGNIFYKSGTFFGIATEAYDTDKDKPGYFYIPPGTDKVYFSLGNSNAGNQGYKNEAHINSVFGIEDHNGKTLKARFVTPNDSALFYIEIPKEAQGRFCRIIRKYYQYSLVFSNINNFLWYAEPKPLPCSNADFSIAVVNKAGKCVTRLTAVSKAGGLDWEVSDLGETYAYHNVGVIELPENSSPNAIITLSNGANCSVTRKLSDDKSFLNAIQSCAVGGPVTAITVVPAVYPNPSTGVFKCIQNGHAIVANSVIIFNAQGNSVSTFTNASQFDISNVQAGIYWYKIVVNGTVFSGKLIKL